MPFPKLMLPAPRRPKLLTAFRPKLLTASLNARAEGLLADLASFAPPGGEGEADTEARASLPRRLFKFRAINDFAIDNLETNTVWLSSASALNDPYDCWLTSPALAAAFSEIKDPEVTASGRLHSIISVSARARLFFREHIWRQTIGSKLDRLQDLTGVTSFTTDNSALSLWAYYGDSHKGMCIEYDPIEFPAPVQSELYPVKYVDSIPAASIESSASVIRAVLTKSRSWSHENEWRLVRFPIECGQNVFVGKPAVVYLGARVSRANLKRILEICRRRKIECCQMEISPHNFELRPRQVMSDSSGIRSEFSFSFGLGFFKLNFGWSTRSDDSERASHTGTAIGSPPIALLPPPSAEQNDGKGIP